MHNWVVICYGNESLLDCDGFTIQSSCGVQQGDPLCPFSFALAINTLVAKIKAPCSLALHIRFFDDGTLIGCNVDLLKALDVIHRGKRFRFEVNSEKCELSWPKNTDLLEFPGDIRRLPTTRFDFLGQHIGCLESHECFLEKKKHLQ